VSHVSLADLIGVDCSVMCFQMSDFESARQAVFNLIAEHEDIDALLREVSICHYCSTNRNVYLTVVQFVGCLIGNVFGLYIDMPNRDSRKWPEIRKLAVKILIWSSRSEGNCV